MDPWRLTTKAQRRINTLAGVALASCGLAWLAGFSLASSGNTGAASIESAGAKSIVERHDPPPSRAQSERTFRRSLLASASIGDVDGNARTRPASHRPTASLDGPFRARRAIPAGQGLRIDGGCLSS